VYSISHGLEIDCPTNLVFEALTSQELLSRWFAPQVIAVPLEGTIAAFAFEFDLNFKMELVSLKKDELVHWICIDGYKEWLDSEVFFRLKTNKSKTILSFEQNNLNNEGKKEKTALSWAEYLKKLKNLCESEII